MMISTKGRYALSIMLDLAAHDDGNYISLKDISERLEISMKYLEAIIAKDYINKLFSFSRSYHFLPSEALLDKIVKVLSELNLFLNQRQGNDLILDTFRDIRKEKSTTKKRKVFCSNIRPLLKERFGDIFKIR